MRLDLDSLFNGISNLHGLFNAKANKCPGYDTKQFDGEAPLILKL